MTFSMKMHLEIYIYTYVYSVKPLYKDTQNGGLSKEVACHEG